VGNFEQMTTAKECMQVTGRRSKLRKWLHKWFVTNRGTHWTIAGSVAVIIFGSYLVHNSRKSNPATIVIMPAAELR
jgi:hypothetical protein